MRTAGPDRLVALTGRNLAGWSEFRPRLPCRPVTEFPRTFTPPPKHHKGDDTEVEVMGSAPILAPNCEPLVAELRDGAHSVAERRLFLITRPVALSKVSCKYAQLRDVGLPSEMKTAGRILADM